MYHVTTTSSTPSLIVYVSNENDKRNFGEDLKKKGL